MNHDTGDAYIHSYPVPPVRTTPVARHSVPNSLEGRLQSRLQSHLQNRLKSGWHPRHRHRMLQVRHDATSLRYYTVHLHFKLIRAWRKGRISFTSLEIERNVLILYCLNDNAPITSRQQVTFNLHNPVQYLDAVIIADRARLIIDQHNGSLERIRMTDPDSHLLVFKKSDSLKQPSNHKHMVHCNHINQSKDNAL